MVAFPDLPDRLFTQTRTRNAVAENELFSQLLPHLRVVFAALGAPGNDLDDLLQECAIRIHRCLPEIRTSRQLRTVTRLFATNTLIDQTRKRCAKNRVDFLPHDTFGNIAIWDFPLVELEELKLSLALALRELPTTHRKTFRLVNTRGLSFRRTAEILGVSHTTVRNWHRKLTRRLRKAVSGKEGSFEE